jgi:hypothetical protein
MALDSYAQSIRQSAEVLRSISEAMELQEVVPSQRIEHRARWMLLRMHCAKIDAIADNIEYGETGAADSMGDDNSDSGEQLRIEPDSD